MIDERQVFVLRFRELADAYARLADADGIEPLKMYALDTEAGELVIAAHARGYLALPALTKLVEWAATPEDEPGAGKVAIAPCAANVFNQVCGFHAVPVAVSAEGAVEITGEREGGIIPTMLPNNSPALHRPKLKQAGPNQYRTKARHRVLVCKLLADEIERTDPREARDRWIYEQAVMGQTWRWIADNVPDWCPDREQITSIEGVRRAAERYRQKHNLPAIPKRKAGRRKNIN